MTRMNGIHIDSFYWLHGDSMGCVVQSEERSWFGRVENDAWITGRRGRDWFPAGLGCGEESL